MSLGRHHDTPEFAVASIRQWWKSTGQKTWPEAKQLFITADSGGGNGYPSNAWKLELQKFADATKVRVRVGHFPPGTSKWNRIEHRPFRHITQDRRGKPLTPLETLVELVGDTRTESGVRVRARLDHRRYPTGIAVTRADLKSLALVRARFHGEWNCELRPRKLYE